MTAKPRPPAKPAPIYGQWHGTEDRDPRVTVRERAFRRLIVEVIGCMLVFTVGIVAVCTTAVFIRTALAVWGLAQ